MLKTGDHQQPTRRDLRGKTPNKEQSKPPTNAGYSAQPQQQMAKPNSMDLNKTIRELGFGGNGIIVLSTNTNIVTKYCKVHTVNTYGTLLTKKSDYPTRPGRSLKEVLKSSKYLVDTSISKDKKSLLMGYVDGLDLKIIFLQRNRAHPVDVSVIRYILSHSLNALQTLHQEGFVHHDIKPDNIMIDLNMQLKLIDYDHVKDVQKVLTKPFGTKDFVRYQENSWKVVLNKNNTKAQYTSIEEDYFALGMTIFSLMVYPYLKEPKDIVTEFNASSGFNVYNRESSYEQWLNRLKQVYHNLSTEHSSAVSSDRSAVTQSKPPDEKLFEVVATLLEYSPAKRAYLQDAMSWSANQPPQQLIEEILAAAIPYFIGQRLSGFKANLVCEFTKVRDDCYSMMKKMLDTIDLKDLENWFGNLYDDIDISTEWSIEQMIYFVVRKLIDKVKFRITCLVLQLTAPQEDTFLNVETTIRLKESQEIARIVKRFKPELIAATGDQQNALINDLRMIHGADTIDSFHPKPTQDEFTSLNNCKTGKYADGIKQTKNTFGELKLLYDSIFGKAMTEDAKPSLQQSEAQLKKKWKIVHDLYKSLPLLMVKMADMLLLLHDKLSMRITIDEQRLTDFVRIRFKNVNSRRLADSFAEQLKLCDKIYCSRINSNTLQEFGDNCLDFEIKHQTHQLSQKVKEVRELITSS